MDNALGHSRLKTTPPDIRPGEVHCSLLRREGETDNHDARTARAAIQLVFHGTAA
jgi:hypothetical protein